MALYKKAKGIKAKYYRIYHESGDQVEVSDGRIRKGERNQSSVALTIIIILNERYPALDKGSD